MEILEFLKWPLLASLIIAGIHAYLGVHVVERGVIFVDLALAQIAALGATMAILVGMDPHGPGSYWISLAFAVLGAGIFAVARTQRNHIPQEAFIGIAYAVASAATILVMSKATGETEHLKDMLVGNILAVSKEVVWRTAVLYAVVGFSTTSSARISCSSPRSPRPPRPRACLSASGIFSSMCPLGLW